MNGPQASGLPPKPEAQGLQEKQKQSQLNCHPILGHCSFSHHHPQQSLRGSIGHACDHEQRRMMVRTSVLVEFIISKRGWAIRHRTENFDLPIPQLPTDLHHHPTSSRLPYQGLGIAIVKLAPWHLRGKPRAIHRTRVKRYKIPVRKHQDKNEKSRTCGATM